MHVWDHRNRRHRGLARKPPRPQAYASTFQSREGQDHEQGLQDEEIRRQELEGAEVDIKQEEIRRLILEYVDDTGGKKELDEVADNLKHWKDSCAALGYESDGERLPQTTQVMADGSEDVEDFVMDRAAEEQGERSRRKKAKEVFDMFDADGSHTISTSEMKSLLQEMCIPMKRPQLKELMREIDTDGSGEVDFDEFYEWYKENASAARNADKTQTVGLFATKLIKGLTGFTFRMEALRIIIAHAQSQASFLCVEKRERERFRLTRPPRMVCDHCGESFASAREKNMHNARRELHHETWEAAEREATRRFHPVSVILDHTAPPLVEGAPSEPHRSPDAPTARKKRLRRLVFSDKFYILYGGVGWGGMGSGGVERVEEKRWVNKPHPRLPDPDDRRGDQLRRRQSVEGINPSDSRAKVPLEVTRGGLAPNWGGVRRGRVMKRVSEREATIVDPPPPLLSTSTIDACRPFLTQEKARATNVFTADDALARARVTFRWEGWSSQQVSLHAEFNSYKKEGMGEDQTEGRIGHEASHSLSPGAYKYFFMVDGRRRVDDSLPVVGDGTKSGDLYNVVTVTNQHLGEEGERALSSVQQRQQRQNCNNSPRLLLPPPTASAATLEPLYPNSSAQQHQPLKCHEEDDEEGDLADPPEEAAAGPGPGGLRVAPEAVGVANRTPPKLAPAPAWTGPLRRIDLSRHQIADDGAVALALALRQNVRVEELDLSFNRISGEGIAALAASLGNPCCRVLRLGLSQNGIGRRGGEHVGMMLKGCEGAGQWGQVPCLRELNLANNMLGDDGTEHLSTGLSGHPCLETLILDGNDIGYDGTQSLCESLLQNASLKTLTLRRNCLLADSAQRLAGLLLRNGAIETLDLAYNPVGAEGLRRLSAFLFRNTRVETLGLRGCEIQPDGVKSGIYSLAQSLCANGTLTSLDLAANELDEYAGQELAHALVKNKTLAEMDLTGNCIPDEWLRENHKVCSEVYGILPSLAESLRLNLARKRSYGGGGRGGGEKGGYTGRPSPRTAQNEKVRASKARAAERKKRAETRKRREALARRSMRRRRQRRQQRRQRQRARDEEQENLRLEATGGKGGDEECNPGEGGGSYRHVGRGGVRCG
ncbi:unnamed protein product [Pylaiella littoralis]